MIEAKGQGCELDEDQFFFSASPNHERCTYAELMDTMTTNGVRFIEQFPIFLESNRYPEDVLNCGGDTDYTTYFNVNLFHAIDYASNNLTFFDQMFAIAGRRRRAKTPIVTNQGRWRRFEDLEAMNLATLNESNIFPFRFLYRNDHREIRLSSWIFG